MSRFPVLILVLVLLLSLSACATRGGVNDLAQRVALLELELGMTHASDGLNRENIQDLDQRLTFLENEARSRGVNIPVKTDQDYAPADAQEVRHPTPAPSPAPAQPQRQAPPATSPSPSLPLSPASTQSPQSPEPEQVAEQPADLPGSLPFPVEAENLPVSPQVTVEPAPTAQSAPAVSANGSASQRAYDAALQMYRTGRFAEADAAFAAFLMTYPDSRLVPNALYWRGESFYARGMYVDAIFAFKDVQTRFPDQQKTPDSLLKTAMAYKRLNDNANASLHLSVLFEDWPGSEAAKRAQSMGLAP